MAVDTIKNYEKLNQIFKYDLTADLIAEHIVTCSPEEEAGAIKEKMLKADFNFYGVKADGRMIGFVSRDELGAGKIEQYIKSFTTEDLISDSTSLIDLLHIFQNKERVFILEKNEISKLITVADLHKQPIRMLVFSLISILEMHLVNLIGQVYPDNAWIDKLPPERVESAEKLLTARMERNQALTLLDNIQLSDKGTIVRRSEELIQKLGFESKNKCKTFFRQIERLRNNTAHSQQEIYPDNQEMIELVIQVKGILQQ